MQPRRRWTGDYFFLLSNLVQKDFKIRYRNMSLGVFWSLLNPIIMMAVLTFIFTRIFPPSVPQFPLFLLCGLIPFNFFAISWITGTTSLVENTSLIKRISVPRKVFPLASILSNCVHLAIQLGLLLILVMIFGRGATLHWLWLPLIWALFIIFVFGLSLVSSAVNVYIRDVRYVVESANTVLFWLVPIFYSFAVIPLKYTEVYRFNPVAAVVLMLRSILLEGRDPEWSTLRNLTLVAAVTLTIGIFVFNKLKSRFFEYL
ncbi:MAG: ABC transporter permease [Acidobacteriota bacterium]|nr:ABC transporter permease [Acidobacteriota bacterium]